MKALLTTLLDPLRNSVINAASAIPTPVAGQHIPLGHFSVSSDGLGMSQSLEGSSLAGLHDQSCNFTLPLLCSWQLD